MKRRAPTCWRNSVTRGQGGDDDDGDDDGRQLVARPTIPCLYLVQTKRQTEQDKRNKKPSKTNTDKE